jgi:hypothetical protein
MNERERAYQRQWYARTCKRRLAIKKTQKQRLKAEVLQHYSPTLTCQQCGFSDIRALSIDHIHGGGNEHRRRVSTKSGFRFYLWLKKHHFPSGFQVLCMNCQFIKAHEQQEYRGDPPTCPTRTVDDLSIDEILNATPVRRLSDNARIIWPKSSLAIDD